MTPEAESLDQESGLALSPVIRGLRFAGEEVQFGLVLAAICQDSAVAAAFVDAVITKAKGGNPGARRRVRHRHGEVRCVNEQQLQARVGRLLHRARRNDAQDVGIADLWFAASGDWTLAVELKQNSVFGPQQLEGYAKSGPVATIVRDASKVEVSLLKEHHHWIGAASWNSLLGDLWRLPVDARWTSEWQALLTVMESDGEFHLAIPSSREVQAQVDLCQALATPLVEHLIRELRRVYKAEAENAVSGLKPLRVSRSGAWAVVEIGIPHDKLWLSIAIRNLWSLAPRLSIDCWDYAHFRDWRARRRLEQAHARIEALHFKRLGYNFRFEQPMQRLAHAKPQQALIVISEILTEVVDTRIFDVAVERCRGG